MNGETEVDINVHIRWMIRRDMVEILDIEQASFEFPWVEKDFLRCLRQLNCIGMVAEYDDRVVGFMVYQLKKEELHVLNLSVCPQARRRRVGQQMVNKLVSKLSHRGRSKIVLEVRERNLAAQLFFKNSHFRAISVLRDYYDTAEDAYVMQYRLDEKSEPVSCITTIKENEHI